MYAHRSPEEVDNGRRVEGLSAVAYAAAPEPECRGVLSEIESEVSRQEEPNETETRDGEEEINDDADEPINQHRATKKSPRDQCMMNVRLLG